jgi:hypothetical protein
MGYKYIKITKKNKTNIFIKKGLIVQKIWYNIFEEFKNKEDLWIFLKECLS